MNELVYEFEESNVKDFAKLISFAAKEIEEITIKGNKLIITYDNYENEAEVKRKIEKVISNYRKESKGLDEVELFKQNDEKQYMSYDEIYGSEEIKNWGEGVISLNGKASKLLRYFDNVFKNMALSLGAIEREYPTLLPLEVLNKAGYMKKTPQYPIFCSNIEDDIDSLEQFKRNQENVNISNYFAETNHVLSPAACFHAYIDYQNHEFDNNTLITLNQNVFRNEGKFNWNDFGRLKDYHIREIIFIGDDEYVEKVREELLAKSKEFMTQLKLNCKICVTFDPFIMPTMQKFKKVQMQEHSKYELQVQYSDTSYCAIASFNLHGEAFTNPFNIKVKNNLKTVTGCVGFGLERMVLTFISQYGLDDKSWPKIVKDAIGDM